MSVGAALALAIVLLGIYGSCALLVATRRRELGIRSALGASRGRLHRQVYGPVIRVVLAGSALALIISVVIGPLISAVSSTADLLVFSGRIFLLAVLLVAIGALIAAFPGAIGAGRVSPAVALRSES